MHIPKKVHVEESPSDEVETQVQEACDEDTCESGALNTHEVIPELSKVCNGVNTVLHIALK